MSFITAVKDLHNDLILAGQPAKRCNELTQELIDAIEAHIDIPTDNIILKGKVTLHPWEVLAVQHFLTQFGFHLHRVSVQRNHMEEPLTYVVFPNWK